MKRIAYVAIVMGLAYAGCFAFGLSTLVIPWSIYKEQGVSQREMQSGERFYPFAGMRFDEGEWKAYLVNSPEDLGGLPKSVTRSTCLVTKNVEVLDRLKNLEFTYTGGDMATVTSKLFLFQNGKLMYSAGVLLTEDIEGLQSEELGWIEPVEGRSLTAFVSRLRRVYAPIVFL